MKIVNTENIEKFADQYYSNIGIIEVMNILEKREDFNFSNGFENNSIKDLMFKISFYEIVDSESFIINEIIESDFDEDLADCRKDEFNELINYNIMKYRRLLEKGISDINEKIPSIEELSKGMKYPIKNWPGNCYAVSCALSEYLNKNKILENTKPVYGAYFGKVHEKSIFRQSEIGVNHGWVSYDGLVIDPTKWVFTNTKPEIYIGMQNEDYDQAGQRRKHIKDKILGNNNFDIIRTKGPNFDEKSKIDEFNFNNNTKELLSSLFSNDNSNILSMNQIFWLANAPVSEIDECIEDIYKNLEEKGYGAFIPIDNKELVNKSGFTL